MSIAKTNESGLLEFLTPWVVLDLIHVIDGVNSSGMSLGCFAKARCDNNYWETTPIDAIIKDAHFSAIPSVR